MTTPDTIESLRAERDALLAALREIEVMIECAGYSNAWKIARAAIAKAEGKA